MYRRGSSRRGRRVSLKISRDESLDHLIRKLYSVYYSLRPCIEEPPDIQHREFAFQPFDIDSYVRHISFESHEDLLDYLASRPPRHAYYSIARYELPEAKTMEEKVFLGAWLLFDLDLDHVEACEEYTLKLEGGESLLDDRCLLEGYRLMLRLERMINRDLSPEDTIIYYTGHRGFHMRVVCSECEDLDRNARKQIALYFAGEGIDITRLFPQQTIIRRGKRKIRLDPAIPSRNDPGWRGWIGEALAAKAGSARGLREAFGESWEEVVLSVIREIAVPIDVLVTQDPSRLTRLHGSLNGKGHFIVSPVESGFKPSLRLTPFEGSLTVRFREEIDDLSLLGVSISSGRGVEEELPAGVALHLAWKGAVEILGGEVIVRASSCWRPL